MHLKEQHDKNENDVDLFILFNIDGHNKNTNAKATHAIVGQMEVDRSDKNIVADGQMAAN
jgi:uncharacterized membrane protein